jgi:hypothetical protein
MFLSKIQYIHEGDYGIRQTCARIRQQINLGRNDPSVIQATHLAIGRNGNKRSQVEISKSIVAWFLSHVRYEHDDHMSMTEQGIKQISPAACPQHFQKCEPVEEIYTPPQVLAQGFGDCDDFCSTLGAMHEIAGMRTKLVTIAADPTSPREFSHIYLLVNADGRWVPVDAVNRSQPWGWELPHPYRKEIMC